MVILGKTGRNFAAGMSGGIAYVLDEDHDLYLRLNKDQVVIDGLTESQDIQELRRLIEDTNLGSLTRNTWPPPAQRRAGRF